MKRLTLTAAWLGCFLLAQATTPWSQRMVEARGVRNFYSNTTLKDTMPNSGWDYVTGLVANAVIKTWEMYPEKTDYYRNVKAFADKFASNVGANLGTSNIDDLAAGKMYFALYRKAVADGNATDAAKYKTAVTVIRNKLKFNHSRISAPKPGAGGFWHKASYPDQMWLDGLYMGPAVYAQWQAEFGVTDSLATNASSWSDIAFQFKTLNQQTYDSVKQLNYHAWSANPTDTNSFWCNRTPPFLGCSKEFWGRSMGWMFAALVDVMEVMPKDHPDFPDLLGICRQVAAGLKRWQDPTSGAWFQLLQYDGSKKADPAGDPVTGYNKGTQANYLESSCSSMFTYAFLKALRLGYIDEEVYRPVAKKAYAGLLATFITLGADGRPSIEQSCASAGLGASSNLTRSGTVNYYLCGKDVGITRNEGKAIGPFIMASLEYERYQADSVKAANSCRPTSCCSKDCYVQVPSDGVYLFRFTSPSGTPYLSKQQCKAGWNKVSYPAPDPTMAPTVQMLDLSGRLLASRWP